MLLGNGNASESAMRYKLGMVLSGGGVRGVAHIGALAALGERDLEVDCLAGTSAGAIVGAFYAAGCPTEAMLEFFTDHSPFRLSMISMSKPGIIDSAKVRADLLHYLPADSFEALGKRLFLYATDLVHGKLAVFDSRSADLRHPRLLVDAGSLHAIEIDGRWYADGASSTTFPSSP